MDNQRKNINFAQYANIMAMKEDINGFETEVDAALSTSNALTVVEVKTYD